jgi:hypothetical protein
MDGNAAAEAGAPGGEEAEALVLVAVEDSRNAVKPCLGGPLRRNLARLGSIAILLMNLLLITCYYKNTTPYRMFPFFAYGASIHLCSTSYEI